MLLKFHAVWLPLLVALPSVSSAQKTAPDNVGMNTVATQRQYARDWDAEEHRYLQALDVATKAQSDQRAAIYSICLNLAHLYQARHRYTEAEMYYERAYNLAKTLFGYQNEEVVKPLNLLGHVWLDQGRFREADGAFRQALKILELEKDPNRIETAAVLNNLAAVQHMNGNLSRAAALMRKVVGIFEADPAADEEDFGIALSNLAATLQEMGTSTEAITTARKAVTVLERCENSDHLAVSLVTLSRLYLDEGDSAGGEAMLQRALRSIEDLGQEDSPARALVFGHLGVLYAGTGRYRQAEPYLQRAIEINQRLLGPDHPRLLESMEAYANLLRMTKRKGEAKKLEAYIREQRERYQLQNPAVANFVDISSIRQRGH
jgi:tetratricopeptide (TPR) repeat protein